MEPAIKNATNDKVAIVTLKAKSMTVCLSLLCFDAAGISIELEGTNMRAQSVVEASCRGVKEHKHAESQTKCKTVTICLSTLAIRTKVRIVM